MEKLARTWWLVLIRGLAAILFGLLALFWPGITVLVLVVFFGAYAIVNGVFSILSAFRHETQSRVWTIISGIIGILAGVVAFLWPGITLLVLLYVIAFWAIFTGVAEIMDGIRLRKEIDNEWTLILAGALSVIFGILLLIWPGPGMLSLVWLIAIFAILYGIALVALSFRVKKMVPKSQYP